MAQLISGTTIAGHSAIHAGNLAAHSIATTSYVTTQINNLINGAPGALDTLNELAAALGNDASFSSTLTSSLAGKVSKAGDTITGKITFPSAAANRPQFPGGMVGLDASDGNFDIWGISRDYYPSHATAANAWGLRWNGDNNDFEFVGGGTSRVILDMDGGNLTITGTISASGYNASNWNTAFGWGNHAGLYAAASHNHDDRYYTETESDSRFVNASGDSMSGSLTIGAGAAYVGTHGTWTGEQNKIQWHSNHLYFQNTGGGNFFFRRADGTNLLNLDNNGSLVISGDFYPNGQGSYRLYVANSGLWTNSNFGADGDIYLGTRGQWLSTYLNQNVRTDSSPSFSSVYLGGSQLTGTKVNGLSNMLGVTTLPYSVDITVDGDPDRFYAVQFWGGDQDVWRRIIIKRGYSEPAPWDPIGTGVHHGGLLLDWEGNFGGWGGAEYADRLRVFNESYTNVCADMFIYSHSMGYVFMLRGGGALYHLFSDQPINGFYQSGSPDILYSSSTLSYDHSNSGYDVYAPSPLGLAAVNSSRIDGLRTKKQSLLDGRYLIQGSDISGISTISATNFRASNAFYLNGTSYFLNSSNGGIYTNARFESAGTIFASGGNSGNWNTAYGWGNHASAGYLTSVTNISGSAGTVTHNASRTDGEWYNVGWFAGNPSPAYSCNAVQIQSSTGTLTATNLIATSNLTATRSYAAIAPTVASSNWNTSFGNTPVSTMAFGGDISAGGPTGTWWFQVNMRHSNASNVWGTQLAYGWEDNANEIYQRNVTGGSYSGWVRYINTNNYAGILDARYYTETEVNNFFSGATAITGYSKSNWDAAYNKRPTAISFSGTGTKTLTLTQGDGSTLTANFSDIDTDTNTDGQTLSLSGNTLSISGGNSVTLTSGGISQGTADSLYVNVGGDTMTGPLNIVGSTDGQDLLAVNGFNGRLFTVTDSVLDTIYSVNTIAGLPILEVLANNTVRIGKYGANSITISNSRIAINSDTVDTNFPFYVSDRSTSSSRYTLANPGMGFNLADSYAQLQLYGTAGAYIDFTTGANDYQGRIMWTGSAFSISGSISATNFSGSSSGTNTGDQTNISGTASNITAYTINQNLGTGNSPTFTDLYNNSWFRNNANNTGLYNQANGNHFYSRSGTAWGITGNGGSVVQLQFRTNHESTVRGSVYGDGSGFGLLDSADNWRVRVDTGGVQVYGSLTVGNSTSSDIYMTDTDETTRRIHCNGGRIGFLTSSNSWGAYADNSGNWFAANLSGTNTGDQTNIAGNAATATNVAWTGVTGRPTALSQFSNDLGNYGGWITSSGSISGNATTATTAARATRANGNFYIDDNYGNGIVGVYASTRLQGVFAMGDSYKLPADGTSASNLYGMAWSHPNAGGVAANLNTHGLLVMENGTFLAAISGSIRARDDMRAPAIYDSGSRVAISRGEGRDYVNYSRYVYNNGTYSGTGWIEPSDLGVRYANSAGSAPNASNANSFYNVTPGEGNGLKLWSSDSYKISMGSSSLYQYGPVNDYSIKTQMNDGDAGRGFTWGRISYAPIAAINATSGNMQIAGTFASSNFSGSHSGSSSGTNTGDQTNISGNSNTTSQRVFDDLKINFPSGGSGGYSFGSSHYSMGLDVGNGGWSHPHYKDLIIGYHTGIRLGAHYSGVRFYNNSPTTDANNDGNGDAGESLLMTVGGYVGTANHTDVVVNNNLFANASMRSPIFYDSNDTAFYVDPNSSSRLRNLYVGDSGSNWSDPGGWGTQLHVSNGPHAILRVYARNDGIETVMFSHGSNQSKVGSGTNHNFTIVRNFSDRMTFYSGYTYAEGYLQAADSLRAPIFYDSNDTAYYLDPNSTSELYKFSGGTLDRNDGNSLHVNSPYLTRAAQNFRHRNGTMGWGSVDLNVIASNWGSGSFDTWSSPANGPGASSHYVGIQAMHYSNSDSARFHGWQMACAQEANNRWFWRSAWDSPRAWVEMIHSGNIGSQTVSRADGALKLWAESHPTDYYIRNNWTGTYWQITSNHPSGVQVAYADSAGSAPANGGTSSNTNSISSAVGGTYYWTGLNYFQSNLGATSGALANPPLQAYCTGGNSAFMSFHRSGNYAVNFGLDSDNVLRMGGWSASANRWQLDMSGNMTVAGDVTAFSDARVKTNVQTIENALAKTLALRGVSYNRTDSDDTRTKIGVIAQETLEVVPEVVNQDNAGMYNVSYGNMTALLIEAIKEQQAQIEDLKLEVKKLRGE
jgi:hypothetical protein